MSSVINTLVTSIQNNVFFACIVLAFIAMALISSLAVIFYKINQKFWKALIPIYNITTLLSVLNIPIWMVLLMLIPFVNIIGIPFMTIVIGWKLGSLCYKNIFIKIGLAICPVLFFPLLAAGRIDLTGKYEKLVVVPVQVPKEFSLDPIVVSNSVEVPSAMNLSQTETLDKIAVKVKKEKPTIEKKENVTEASLAEHLAKADKERPTAQDLTFDYNMIYSAQKEAEQLKTNAMNDNPTFQLLNQAGMVAVEENTGIKNTDNSTLDYSNLYQETLQEEEPAFPKIHELELEVASPVDESNVGPIPINQRYDKQRKVSSEPVNLNVIVAEKPVIEAIEIQPVEIPQIVIPAPEIANLNMVVPPMVDANISSIMAAPPDFSNQVINNNPVQIPVNIPVQEVSIPEPSIQISPMVSMNIEEPNTLPVGILMVEDKGKAEELFVVLPEAVPAPVPQFITEQPQQFDAAPNMLANPSMIFQSQMGAEPMLRQVQAPVVEAQVDKVCPKCGVKLKRDCPVCIMCGYKF